MYVTLWSRLLSQWDLAEVVHRNGAVIQELDASKSGRPNQSAGDRSWHTAATTYLIFIFPLFRAWDPSNHFRVEFTFNLPYKIDKVDGKSIGKSNLDMLVEYHDLYDYL